MSSHYDLCCQNIGKPAKIITSNGEVHRGYIRHVDRSHVFIDPINTGFGGFGMGFWGFPGYGSGLGIGIALGAIATIAFLPFFF
ncbi:hypothetical protein [Saliterribacillus persicus]|uniref:Uncharacterized protein n=1 Tax=Saliterribacillus persicus TaxID=930114 RepID=A0A368YAS3_9BACI|nr:hypothetical protein [Saliterribacillus persicus]RCW76799.1 hypothetical protein DFR57_10274 [Saliterribacillus persicus]